MTAKTNGAEDFYKHFSQDKPTRTGIWITKVFSEKIFKYAKIEPGCKVLEIGPGRGVFADICFQNGVEYFAVEPNKQMAESLEKRGAEVITAMVPPLPQIDKTFDAVVMVNVMEHMNNMQDALQITRQIRQVLKPSGKLVICSPDYLNLRHNFFNCDFSHSYVTTGRRLEQLLISASFGNIKRIYLSGPITGVLCFIISAFISRLPFSMLEACFPISKMCRKLYKIQLTFSRKVLVIGEKHS